MNFCIISIGNERQHSLLEFFMCTVVFLILWPLWFQHSYKRKRTFIKYLFKQFLQAALRARNRCERMFIMHQQFVRFVGECSSLWSYVLVGIYVSFPFFLHSFFLPCVKIFSENHCHNILWKDGIYLELSSSLSLCVSACLFISMHVEFLNIEKCTHCQLCGSEVERHLFFLLVIWSFQATEWEKRRAEEEKSRNADTNCQKKKTKITLKC